MKIKVIDSSICENCRNKKCSFIGATENPNFYNIKTESTVCPTGLLVTGPNESDLEAGEIQSSRETKCVNCCLCVKQCPHNNLKVEDYTYEASDFTGLNEPQHNAISLSYLNNIFDFAANTNRNKALTFDGYIRTITGKQCFVEVDHQNDSLESCRRILGDIISYNHQKEEKISDGLIVLNDIPKKGSRDVYILLEKIKKFPQTKHLSMYIATFALLRYFNLYLQDGQYELSDLFYNPNEESEEEYVHRIKKMVSSTEELTQIFEMD